MAEARESRIFLRLKSGTRYAWVCIEKMPPGESQPLSLRPRRRILKPGETRLGSVYVKGYFPESTDWIRQLPIPVCDGHGDESTVAAVNNKLYLFGGDIYRDFDDNPHIGVSVLDLNEDVGCTWKSAATFPMGLQLQALVSSDGWIYCCGQTCGRFHSQTHEWEEIYMRHMRLVAVSMYNQFLTGGTHDSRQILRRYSARMQHLDEVVRPEPGGYFTGIRYPGVVAGEFLLCVGASHPVTGADNWGVYVFDIERRIWLKEPIQHLHPNGLLLPKQKDSDDVAICNLSRVAPQRYAVVWSLESPSGLFQTEIYWCKFDLIVHLWHHSNKVELCTATKVCFGRCGFEEVTRFDTTVLNIASEVDTVEGDGAVNISEYYRREYI